MKFVANDYEPSDIMLFIRQATGLTQKKFAEGLDLGRTMISHYEKGRKRYYFSTLMKIAKLYGFRITIEKI